MTVGEPSHGDRLNPTRDKHNRSLAIEKALIKVLRVNAPENLAGQMAAKPDAELMEMFQHPEDWQPEALTAAAAELQRRGIDAGSISPAPPISLPAGEVIFFPVSPLKLFIMSTVTFGLYELYWFYKNWKYIKVWTGCNLWPFWRAFFGILFCYPCFKAIREVAGARGIAIPWSAGWLAVVWICLELSWRLPAPLSLLSWLSPLALLQVQYVVNKLNEDSVPGHDPNAKFTAWNIVAIVIGAIFFAAFIFDTFQPRPPEFHPIMTIPLPPGWPHITTNSTNNI
jgi:hypothetical protein